jgi:hypothetical protein
MSNPSLLNIPYRFKAGTLYSQIPDSGLGDFVVSRSASNAATRINAQGFIETVADNVPRLDYPLGGIANGCPALLVEPSAQNICLQSAAFGTSPWGTVSTTVTVNTSATADPFNGNTADKLVANSGLANHWLERNSVQTGNHTFSVFAKAAEYGFIRLIDVNASRYNASFTLSGSGSSSGTGSSIQNYGNGWYRCVVTYDGGGASVYNSLIGIPTAATTINYNGDGTSGVYIFGAQLETGSIATSYIPTTTAAITRGADVINKTGVSSLIGQTEGTLYAEVDIRTFANIGMIATISDGTAANRIDVYKYTDSKIYFDRISSTQSAATGLGSAALTAGIFKVAVAYKSGDTTMYINGAQIGTTQTQTFTFAALTKITIGVNRADNALFFNDRIRSVALYTTRLTNAQLQALTT